MPLSPSGPDWPPIPGFPCVPGSPFEPSFPLPPALPLGPGRPTIPTKMQWNKIKPFLPPLFLRQHSRLIEWFVHMSPTQREKHKATTVLKYYHSRKKLKLQPCVWQCHGLLYINQCSTGYHTVAELPTTNVSACHNATSKVDYLTRSSILSSSARLSRLSSLSIFSIPSLYIPSSSDKPQTVETCALHFTYIISRCTRFSSLSLRSRSTLH